MENYKRFEVKKLNSKELKNINGGFFGILLAAAFAGFIAFAIGNAIGNSNDACE